MVLIQAASCFLAIDGLHASVCDCAGCAGALLYELHLSRLHPKRSLFSSEAVATASSPSDPLQGLWTDLRRSSRPLQRTPLWWMGS